LVEEQVGQAQKGCCYSDDEDLAHSDRHR
jgi:hypothetical protein